MTGVEGTMPRVDVLTITYNQERYIGQCVESVLSQKFEDWRLLIVDDGSEDRTTEIIESYDDERILLIKAEHRGIEKLKESYQLLLEQSASPLLAILDGDDWWPADKLEIEVPAFEPSSVALAFGSVKLYNADNEWIATVRLPAFAQGIREGKTILDRMLNRGFFPFSVTTMVRRSALEAVGGFVQPAGLPLVDVPTWMHILGNGHSRGLPEILGCYRVHKESVCQSRSAAIARGQMDYNEKFIEVQRDKMGLSEGAARKYSQRIRAYHHHRRGVLDMLEDNWPESRRHFKEAFREGRLPRKAKTGMRLMQLLWRMFRKRGRA
ncbi:MAG: glycosyltransferase [Deltaproteobacteria bacterium]|nr:glycosyltransferase [Deltaproteobacteria bacterium]